MTSLHSSFAERVLKWFYEHGRHDLPWQQLHKPTPDPYQVWVSEIMLQQTQVASVIGYYQRFMTNFPTLDDLADAPLDSVLENWAGLGYYARARNLHKTAQILQQILTKTGSYPQTLDEWQALSGIGRSTAGAIMAMGLGKFGVICDGNVKRVLTRHFGIDDDITRPATDKNLWQLAEQLTPKKHSNHYAQAMMDLGATLCTRTRPSCKQCPLLTSCIAYQQGNPTAYPIKTKKTSKPTHHSHAMILYYQDRFLWLKREPTGIWGGLWTVPLLSNTLLPSFAEQMIFAGLEISFQNFEPTTSIRHILTHFHWQLSPVAYALTKEQFNQLNHWLKNANADFEWYNKNNPLAKPTAMNKLMELL